MTTTIRSAALLTTVALMASCEIDGLGPAPDRLEPGTWGGENAGLIVDDSVAHAHFGCTFGNFPMPVAFDPNGRFETPGDYLLRAYPVAIGPTMPARFEGTVRGDELTFTVTVNDTIAKRTVVLGPATVTRGRDPKMGPCPICRVIPAMK